MEKQKRSFTKLTILFYVLGIIMAVYSIFTLYQSYAYVKSLVDAGSLTISESIADVIVYFVSNSMEYIFYASAFSFFGYIIYLFKSKNIIIDNIETKEVVEESNEELDWLEEEGTAAQETKEETLEQIVVKEVDE